MLVVVWPVAWVAFLPVVLIESLVALKSLHLGFRRALLVIAAANAVSTLVGIPITWLVLVIIQIMVGDHSLTHWYANDTLIQSALAVSPQAAWLGLYSDPRRMIPIAAIFLCVPFYFASVWIEYRVVRRMVANSPNQVLRFSWRANLWSYAVIFLFWAGCLATSDVGSGMPRTTAKEASVIAEIEKLGGRVYPYRGVEAEIGKLGGSAYIYEGGYDRSGIAVILSNGQVTDAALEHLQGLSHRLQWLCLNANVTDAGMERVKGLTNLRALALNESKVTDAGLENLKYLTKLRDLSLYKTRITDAGLEHIIGLTGITVLSLSEHTTDAGLERIQGLTQLHVLHLEDSQVTDAGLRYLQELTNLRSLDLANDAQVTDAGLEHIKELTRLEYLTLYDAQVTDAGLKHLEGLTKLKSLDLRGTRVTDEGVKDLQRALPNCRIER